MPYCYKNEKYYCKLAICCKYLIIMINKYDATIDKTTLFYYDKVKLKREFTCTTEKKD